MKRRRSSNTAKPGAWIRDWRWPTTTWPSPDRSRGQAEEAIRHFREAIGLNPDFSVADKDLAATLAGEGKTEAAIGHYREALRTRPDLLEAAQRLQALESQQRREGGRYSPGRSSAPVHQDERVPILFVVVERQRSPHDPGQNCGALRQVG